MFNPCVIHAGLRHNSVRSEQDCAPNPFRVNSSFMYNEARVHSELLNSCRTHIHSCRDHSELKDPTRTYSELFQNSRRTPSGFFWDPCIFTQNPFRLHCNFTSIRAHFGYASCCEFNLHTSTWLGCLFNLSSKKSFCHFGILFCSLKLEPWSVIQKLLCKCSLRLIRFDFTSTSLRSHFEFHSAAIRLHLDFPSH